MEEKLKELPEYTPNYVIDEFKIYLEKKNKGKSGIFTFQNTLALVNLAKVNGRITKKQAKDLKRILKKIK